jgi:hypothetical protein
LDTLEERGGGLPDSIDKVEHFFALSWTFSNYNFRGCSSPNTQELYSL